MGGGQRQARSAFRDQEQERSNGPRSARSASRWSSTTSSPAVPGTSARNLFFLRPLHRAGCRLSAGDPPDRHGPALVVVPEGKTPFEAYQLLNGRCGPTRPSKARSPGWSTAGLMPKRSGRAPTMESADGCHARARRDENLRRPVPRFRSNPQHREDPGGKQAARRHRHPRLHPAHGPGRETLPEFRKRKSQTSRSSRKTR